MRVQRSRKRRRGFTLIEMVVAAVILAVGVAGTVYAFNAATQASAMASEIQTATMLAQKQLAEAEVQAQGNITGGDSDGVFPNNPGYRWKQSVTATDYTYVFQISVTVSWGPVPQKERVLTTYVVNAQNNGTTTTTNTGTAGG